MFSFFNVVGGWGLGGRDGIDAISFPFIISSNEFMKSRNNANHQTRDRKRTSFVFNKPSENYIPSIRTMKIKNCRGPDEGLWILYI